LNLHPKPKKWLGQNFLKDGTILNKIIEAIPNDDNHIVEIGPGLGDLTRYLLVDKKVVAFEIDKELVTHLEKKFERQIKANKLELTNIDVLRHFHKGTLYDSSYNLVANLPYNIATNVLLRVLEDNNCKNIVAMVQKEVASKFVADVADRSYGSLSILCQSACVSRQIVVDVPKECFIPQPKVSSAVIYLQKLKCPQTTSLEYKKFLKICFNANRKTILNNLSKNYKKTNILSVLNSLFIRPNKRPHEVSLGQYDNIYKYLKENDD